MKKGSGVLLLILFLAGVGCAESRTSASRPQTTEDDARVAQETGTTAAEVAAVRSQNEELSSRVPRLRELGQIAEITMARPGVSGAISFVGSIPPAAQSLVEDLPFQLYGGAIFDSSDQTTVAEVFNDALRLLGSETLAVGGNDRIVLIVPPTELGSRSAADYLLELLERIEAYVLNHGDPLPAFLVEQAAQGNLDGLVEMQVAHIDQSTADVGQPEPGCVLPGELGTGAPPPPCPDQ